MEGLSAPNSPLQWVQIVWNTPLKRWDVECCRVDNDDDILAISNHTTLQAAWDSAQLHVLDATSVAERFLDPAIVIDTDDVPDAIHELLAWRASNLVYHTVPANDTGYLADLWIPDDDPSLEASVTVAYPDGTPLANIHPHPEFGIKASYIARWIADTSPAALAPLLSERARNRGHALPAGPVIEHAADGDVAAAVARAIDQTTAIRAERDSLAAELAETRAALADLREHQGNETTAADAADEPERNRLASEHAALETHVAALTRQIEERDATITERDATIAEYVATIRTLRDQVSDETELQARVAQLHDDLNAAATELHTNAAYTSELESRLAVEAEALTHATASLAARDATSQAAGKLEETEADLTEALRRCASLQDTLVDRAELVTTVEDLTASRDLALRDLHEHVTEIEELSATITGLRDQLDSAETAVTERDVRLDETEDTIAALRAQISELEADTVAPERITDLTNELAAAHAENLTLTARAAASEAAQSHTTAANNDLRVALADTADEITARDATIERFKEVLAHTKTVLGEQDELIRTLGADLDAVGEQLEARDRRISGLETALRVLEARDSTGLDPELDTDTDPEPDTDPAPAVDVDGASASGSVADTEEIANAAAGDEDTTPDFGDLGDFDGLAVDEIDPGGDNLEDASQS